MTKLKIGSKAWIENRYGKLIKIPKSFSGKDNLFIAKVDGRDHFNFVVYNEKRKTHYVPQTGGSWLWANNNYLPLFERGIIRASLFIEWYEGILNTGEWYERTLNKGEK